MSAPMAAGVAALLLEQRPELTNDQLKAILMASARRLHLDVFTQGAGLLDARSALAYPARSLNGPALSPKIVVDGTTGAWRIEPQDGSDLAVLWGDAWGDAVLYGDAVLWGDRSIWDEVVLWGD